MRYKTKLVFLIFLLPLLLLTIAYVAFTTTFSLKEATENNKSESIVIKDVILTNASNTITVKNPSFNNNRIDLDIFFNKIDDFVEYEIILENTSSTNIRIKKLNIDDNKIHKYDISYEPSQTINAGETTKIIVKIFASQIQNEKLSLIINY